MTLDEIFDEWAKDAKIDRAELGNAALETPKLHGKYYRFLVQERMVLRKYESDLASLKENKTAWARGELDRDQLKKLGWDPKLKTVLKSDMEDFMSADKDIVQFNLTKMAPQKEKVDLLDSIIKMIANRSFQISNAINFMKYQAGSI